MDDLLEKRRQEGVMTEEVRLALCGKINSLPVPKARIAALFGITGCTLRKWQLGQTRRISGIARMLLRPFLDGEFDAKLLDESRCMGGGNSSSIVAKAYYSYHACLPENVIRTMSYLSHLFHCLDCSPELADEFIQILDKENLRAMRTYLPSVENLTQMYHAQKTQTGGSSTPCQSGVTCMTEL